MTQPMTRFAIRRVRATADAVELIERLVEIHGPVAFVQLGECEDGAAATCLTRGELLPNDEDIKLGEIAGAPFYVNAHVYERAGRPACVVDVAPGAAGGLALEGLEDVHFVIRASEPAGSAQPA
jgi:uncharacterized protein (DUF779 family)